MNNWDGSPWTPLPGAVDEPPPDEASYETKRAELNAKFEALAAAVSQYGELDPDQLYELRKLALMMAVEATDQTGCHSVQGTQHLLQRADSFYAWLTAEVAP
jgi:hypothetical protein